MTSIKKSSTKSKLDTSEYYSVGSAAPSIGPLEYPDIPDTDNPKILHKRHPKTNIYKQKYKEYIKSNALYHLKFFLTAIVVLVSSIIMIMFNAVIAEQQNNLKVLNSELKALKEENVSLELQISEQIDLKYIENEAKERLGMAKPAQYQIVYIDIPKSNYTIQYDTPTISSNTENIGILQLLKNFIGNIFE